MKILGISAFYHDSACALIDNGELLCAVQEERFTRKKHDPAFPVYSIQFCLDKILSSCDISKPYKSDCHIGSKAGLQNNQYQSALKKIKYIAYYDKPFLSFERLLETYFYAPFKGFASFRQAMPLWLGKTGQKIEYALYFKKKAQKIIWYFKTRCS